MAILANYKYLGTKQVPLSPLRHLASGLCHCLDFLLSLEKGINMLPGNTISKVNLKKRSRQRNPAGALGYGEADPAGTRRRGRNVLVLEREQWMSASKEGLWGSGEGSDFLLG